LQPEPLEEGFAMASRCCTLPGWLVLAALAAPAAAQEQPATFEFSFSNPGARSMALGGAFAALADDATAAFANPAGLVQLIEPEFSAEGRASSRRTEFVQGGRVSGEPSGLGIDTVSGLRRGTSERDQTSVPFSSLVYPVKRWSFALYRHTWADFDLASRIDGLFGVEGGEEVRAGDIRLRTRVEVVNSGLAGAFEVTERWSVGVGIVYYEAEMTSFAEEFAQEEEIFYENGTFSPARLDTTYSHRAKDSGASVHAGLLWRASPEWSVGGYFRQGPRLTLRVIETTGPAEEEAPPGTIDLDETSPLDLPDVYGLGVAFRSRGGAWTVGCEWSHVRYSSITEGLDVDVLDPNQIQLADGDEYHFGLEYVFVRSKPVVGLRLGAWRDPAHRVVAGPNADLFERAIFQAGDDQMHFTGGLGLVFDRFQVDLGADLSEVADLGSLSLVYRF
jgi:long-subunit fatty acid transport protein